MGPATIQRQWLYASLAVSTFACGATPAVDSRASEAAGDQAPSAGAGGVAAGSGGSPAAGRGGMAGTLNASGGAGAMAAVGGRIAPAAGSGAAGSLPSFGLDVSQGWVLTVYHTPVESFHSEAPVSVTGCVMQACTNKSTMLGSYAADFVQAVKDEGTGRITSGSYAGKYLNWSGDTGYWLDDAPRDARGQALIPWVTAAADPKVPFGTRFVVASCGVDQADGTPIDRTVCTKIEQASWIVNDRFEVDAVGAHFDLYIGEEDRPSFDDTSPYVITTAHAQITLSQ